MAVAAVVLAAGEASRFGSPKQRILLPRVLERLRETSVDEIVVVEGAYALEVPDDAKARRLPRLGARARGVAALRALARSGPRSRRRSSSSPTGRLSLRRRSSASSRSGGDAGGVVAASYEGGRGHPLVIGRADWSDIPDEGLRDYPVRLVPCDDLGAPGDVDTKEDLRERSWDS